MLLTTKNHQMHALVGVLSKLVSKLVSLTQSGLCLKHYFPGAVPLYDDDNDDDEG